MRKLLFVSALAMPVSAIASTDVAYQLGNMLASEEFCDLSYNQEAIAAFIEKHVDEGDMNFAGTLDLMTAGHSVDLKDMNASAKTAHCTQIRRAAKKHGFTD